MTEPHGDPDDHDYSGDGTSRCAVCEYPMNAHEPMSSPYHGWPESTANREGEG